jgi:hypothetical protein
MSSNASPWSTLLFLTLCPGLVAAAPNVPEKRPLDWVRAAFGTPPEVYKAPATTDLAVLVKAPERAALSAVADVAKALALGAKRERATESVCLAVADARGVKNVASVMLTGSQYAELTKAIPVLGKTEIGMALNLKAAGLTTEPVFINLQPDDATRAELMAMAASGTVRLTAKLLKSPSPEQTAIARIETDKGPLGLKMILDTPDLKVGENALVFSTPSRRQLSVPLLRLPRLKEVLTNLVTPAGLARLVPLRLAVGTDARAGFVVDFKEEEAQVPELGKTLGAVPVDGVGRVVGPAVTYDWAPVLRSSHALRGPCKHTLTLTGVGEEGYVAALDSFYPGDDRLIEKVLPFDPAKQVPAEQFGNDENCASEQGS